MVGLLEQVRWPVLTPCWRQMEPFEPCFAQPRGTLTRLTRLNLHRLPRCVPPTRVQRQQLSANWASRGSSSPRFCSRLGALTAATVTVYGYGRISLTLPSGMQLPFKASCNQPPDKGRKVFRPTTTIRRHWSTEFGRPSNIFHSLVIVMPIYSSIVPAMFSSNLPHLSWNMYFALELRSQLNSHQIFS